MSHKPVIFAVSVSLMMAISTSSFAIQRKHRPWFSHSSPTPEAPDRSLPAPAVASGGKGEQIAQQASEYKGTRYRWGGTSKHGIDCSGLVTRVWEDLKLKKIPRASSALYNAGKPVHLAELRPGDLVFFKKPYRRGVSHVGVYAGNNKFIHAAGHAQGVTITKLSDPYYQLHYAGARRLY